MSVSMSPTDALRIQWSNPSGIFSLLQLVGGEVVQKAIATLVGYTFSVGRTEIGFTPVVFSFGWVAYSLHALSGVFGENRLMPIVDVPSQVINCDNGYVRNNRSWLLGRFLRDCEASALSRFEVLRQNGAPPGSTGSLSLMIEVFEIKAKLPGAGQAGPKPGKQFWLALIFLVLQQLVALAPLMLFGDWTILVVTVSGTLLALATGALPQWISEKWSAHYKSNNRKTVAITRGNGSQYVVVLMSHPGTLDIEALASNRGVKGLGTRISVTILAVLWVVLLITVTGLKDHTWFLVAVGGLGTLQNLLVSAISSEPLWHDLALQSEQPYITITGYQYDPVTKDGLKRQKWTDYTSTDAGVEFHDALDSVSIGDVMGTLMELERRVAKAGASLLPLFFPGSVDYEGKCLKSKREQEFWKYAKDYRGRSPPLEVQTAADQSVPASGTASDTSQDRSGGGQSTAPQTTEAPSSAAVSIELARRIPTDEERNRVSARSRDN